jgi:exodeoxyribonuclease VII large subunit
LQRSFVAGLERRQARLAALNQLLGTLGYKQVLARGFALVRDTEGHALRKAAEIADGARLDIEFADGHVAAVAGEQKGVTVKKAPNKTRKSEDQESLF